jgi:hypothetical protein
MTPEDARLLVCPACGGGLAFRGRRSGANSGTGPPLPRCRRPWAVRDGCRLVDDAQVRGVDWVMRAVARAGDGQAAAPYTGSCRPQPRTARVAASFRGRFHRADVESVQVQSPASTSS